MLMLCPICAGEFETQAGVCLNCDFVLIPSTLNQETPRKNEAAEKSEVQFVELCRPMTNPEAMLIKDTLEQNNVAVLIQGVHSLSLMPHLAFGGQLRVLVGRDQLEYAQALYKAYFESDEGSHFIEDE
jgi:hypothetical protein